MTFTSNGTVNIKVRDALGNEESTSFVIGNIDTTAPVISEVVSDPLQSVWTAGSVKLTVSATDAGAGLASEAYSFDGGTSWQAADNMTFTSNGTVNIKVRDALGNEESTSFVIGNIDTTAPVISEVVSDPLQSVWTAGSVKLTVSATDAGAGLASEAYSFDGGTSWQAADNMTFTSNGTVNIKVRDALGNEESTSFVIGNIDTTAPVISEVVSDPLQSVWTIDSVKLTVSATDAGVGLATEAYSFDDGATWQADNYMSFSSNGTVNIKVRDALGNEASTSFVIGNIDTTAPVISEVVSDPLQSVWTAGSVKLTVSATDAGAGLASEAYSFDGGTSWQAADNMTFTSNGTVNIKVRDALGNEESTSFVISNIDTTIPELLSFSANPNPEAIDKPITLLATGSDLQSGINKYQYKLGNTGAWTDFVPGVTTIIFNEAQVTTIYFKVIDNVGNESDPGELFVAIYDPLAGFVTGGGWINSPAGAYVSDPTAEGKANFGFVSKYQKGAKVPTGNTQFQFKAGDLNFNSTEYEWLVIAGSKAQYKGTGTINGTGSYGFMLTAFDGGKTTTPDKFRIKIWDKATGNIVYDNQLGASDTADATTAIAGGSIVIHSK